jgi:DNA polymerase III epsilon subunit-like protein
MSSLPSVPLQSVPLSFKPESSIGYPKDGFPVSLKSERYTLTFDFETSGLPDKSIEWDDFEPATTMKKSKFGKPYTAQKSDASKWPHSVQFCYILYDNQENVAKVINEILRMPEGTVMTAESESIHHISLEKSQGRTRRVLNIETGEYEMDFNRSIGEILREFMVDFRKASVIVAHNIRFDKNMLLVEMDRLKNVPGYEEFEENIMEIYSNKKEFCTGQYGADVCKIVATNKVGKEYYKMPKLIALYTHLFGYSPDETKLHDALMDVVVCMRSFYKIRYDVDLCNEKLDAQIVELINVLSPEGHKCIVDSVSPIRKSERLSNKEVAAVVEDILSTLEVGVASGVTSSVAKGSTTKKNKKGNKSRGKKSRKNANKKGVLKGNKYLNIHIIK